MAAILIAAAILASRKLAQQDSTPALSCDGFCHSRAIVFAGGL
jgi:hypothetical protein